MAEKRSPWEESLKQICQTLGKFDYRQAADRLFSEGWSKALPTYREVWTYLKTAPWCEVLTVGDHHEPTVYVYVGEVEPRLKDPGAVKPGNGP